MKRLKAYLGLSFAPQSTLAKAIQSFRSRFDEKYNAQRPLEMSLFSPFYFESRHEMHLIDLLREEVGSFFEEGAKGESYQIRFVGHDGGVFSQKMILYLRPVLGHDWDHCVESFMGMIRPYRLPSERKKDKLMLPLARMSQDADITQAMERIQEEIKIPFQLPPDRLMLYTKNGTGDWRESAKLFQFTPPIESFANSLAQL